MGAARRIENGWSRLGINPACALQLFGMRRSGNHAIIDWLMRNAPEHATGGVFLNDCRWGSDPLATFANAESYDASAKHLGSAGKLAFSAAGSVPMIAISYEDRAPLPGDQAQKASRGFERADFCHAVVVYRSFLNWSASLLAKLQRNPGYGPLDRLRIMANALPYYKDCLERVAEPSYFGINYDHWVSSEQARLDILARLNLPVRDNSLGKVQRFGGGSSFKDQEAQPERTTSRDDLMLEAPEYQMLLWTVTHDLAFMKTLAVHFPEDAERLVTMAETSELTLELPQRSAPQ